MIPSWAGRGRLWCRVPSPVALTPQRLRNLSLKWPCQNLLEGKGFSYKVPETTIQKKHPFSHLEYALADARSELDVSASSSIAGVEQKVPVLHRACHAQRWADTLSGVLCIAVSAHLTAALQTWVASGVTGVLCDLLCPNSPNLIPSLHQKGGYICV